MWFRNVQPFRLGGNFYSDDTLEAALSKHAARDPGPLETEAWGWASALAGGDARALNIEGRYLLRLRRSERILPASVVRDEVTKRVEALEAEQDREVYRKERTRIREEVHIELLPRAFVRAKETLLLVAPSEGWVFVDTPNRNAAEEVTKHLRDALGSLPLENFECKESAGAVMTRWLGAGDAKGVFELGEECELRAATSGIVRVRDLDLASPEIRNHLRQGLHAHQLALVWPDHLRFVLEADGSCKRLRFDEALRESADEIEEAMAQQAADALMMSAELVQLYEHLSEALGGLDAE
ncbi:MAG: recombination-associated protein RdgC [Gammaproteobacteria bacterium]